MIALNGDSFNAVYAQLLEQFKTGKVRRVSPRGLPTLELKEPVGWTIEKPWACWLTFEGRKLNPWFSSSEVLWILSGRDDVEWIAHFNSNMRKFADPGRTRFNAGYGHRLFKYPIGFSQFFDPERPTPTLRGKELNLDQIEVVVKKLKQDPDTRQAVALIWHPLLDNQRSNDLACNLAVHFTIRDEKLHTMVTQRSADLVWGVPYNSVQFQHLAALVCGELGLARGAHTHVVNSLHVYEELYKETWEALQRGQECQFDQSLCNVFLKREAVTTAADWVDRFCFGPAHYTFHNLVAHFHEMQKENPYLAQLSTLPLLYDLYKKKALSVIQIRTWAEENLEPFWVFLIQDFWGEKWL